MHLLFNQMKEWRRSALLCFDSQEMNWNIVLQLNGASSDNSSTFSQLLNHLKKHWSCHKTTRLNYFCKILSFATKICQSSSYGWFPSGKVGLKKVRLLQGSTWGLSAPIERDRLLHFKVAMSDFISGIWCRGITRASIFPIYRNLYQLVIFSCMWFDSNGFASNQSWKMSRIWWIYPCKFFGDLG